VKQDMFVTNILLKKAKSKYVLLVPYFCSGCSWWVIWIF